MAEKPEDLNLPNAVVVRLVKEALPDGVSISKEARSAIGKAASVFVLYATSCANNFALSHKRKTLQATDVISALEDMEFEQFIPQLKQDLNAFQKEQKGKKEAAAESKRKKKEVVNNEEAEPDAKKQKTDDENSNKKNDSDGSDKEDNQT
ncbi:predicted protein [Nematostella vectensis]|uniref:DNA polymerase epsilon subunit 3 n=1 Tax=Nematostella vectensis TaxID=45351 RepID=A7SG28_NEMVE|nr:predicted protein [Nematostella vectensis]|eukprot:XP_001629370.1 predicted protein [Nematostella vectensis]